MLSLDKAILERNSAVQRRLVALAEKTGEITVCVPARKDIKERISEHLTVYSFSGPKITQLWKMWRMGKSLIVDPLSLTKNPSAHQNEPLPLGKGELRGVESYYGKLGNNSLARCSVKYDK